MKKFHILFYIVAAASLLLNVFLLSNLVDFHASTRGGPPSDEDTVYINMAVEQWGVFHAGDAALAMTGRAPKILYGPHEVCVQLELVFPAVGGVPIYCFDTRTKQLTHKFDLVE